MTAANSTALLESQKLLGTEAFVVDLRGRLDKVLQMGAGQEVAKVDEFAVLLILDFDIVSLFMSGLLAQGCLPLTTPQRFCRPRTCLPPTTIVFSEPTTANGIMFCNFVSDGPHV